MKLPIYLDNHATTQVDPKVLEAMMPYFCEHFGNAASRNHTFGWIAESAVDQARNQIAQLIGGKPEEIIFTSGATESNNLAMKGVAEMYADRGDHIITVVTEHRAVLDPCMHLKKKGFRITYLSVNENGKIDFDQLRDAITAKTILVSIMHANNEIGTIQDIRAIGAMCKERNVFFHTDATQSIGKIPFNVDEMKIDLASFSAHKMYGPKGIGALYIRRNNPRVRLAQQIDGGGHEQNMRSGTLNVPGIVGFGKACELCKENLETESQKVLRLREKLFNSIIHQLDDVSLNGDPNDRLPGNLNLSFMHVSSELFLSNIKEIAVSTGSACSSATLEASYVLKAIGAAHESARSSIRFGLGRFTTEEEIDYTIQRVVEAVNKIRNTSSILTA